MKKIVSIFLITIVIIGAFIATPVTTKPETLKNANKTFANVIGENPQGNETDLYTADGNKIYYLKETGMLVAQKGDNVEPVFDPTDSSITLYREETNEFITGDEKTLSIYLDSRLNKAYLKSGSMYVRGVKMSDTVYLINFREDKKSKPRLIYAFRETVKKDWYKVFNPFNWGKNGMIEYKFFDMNGHQIKDEHIVEWETSLIKSSAIGLFGLVPFLLSNALGGNKYPVVKIIKETTLSELMNDISHVTEHPWEQIYKNDLPVITEDGSGIYINPRTKQLTNYFGWALFNSENGLPIVMHNDEIITTDFSKQNVVDNVLINSSTVDSLLESGRTFFIGTIYTSFGVFDVPVFEDGENGRLDGEWLLMNGKSATDVIQPMYGYEILNGQTFGEFIKSGVSSIGNFIETLIGNLIEILIRIGLVLFAIACFGALFRHLSNGARVTVTQQKYITSKKQKRRRRK